MGADIAGSNEITDLARSLSSFFRKHFRGSVSVSRWNRANLRATRFSKSLRIFFLSFFFFLRRRVNVFNDEFFSLSRSPRRTDYYYYYRLKIRGEKGSFVSFHSFNKMKGKFKNSSIFEKKRDYLFKNLYIVRKEKPNLKLRKCF